MQAVTDAFAAAMRADAIDVAVRVDLYTAGLVSMVVPDLAVVGGSVTVDRTAATRRSCTLDLADDGTQTLTTLLAGTGQGGSVALEVVVRRGVRYLDGTVELVPLGVFRVSQARTVDIGRPTLQVTGYDRSRTVARARLTTTYYVNAGVTYLAAAQALVDSRLPFTVAKVVETVAPTVTPTTVVYAEQDDPWQRVQELCATVGAEVFFDVDGSLRIRDVPDPTTGPVAFEFLDDVTSIVLSLEHVRDDEPGYNATIVTGESSSNTAAPARAMAYDADPSSPTYFFGPYGQVPEFSNDPLVTTTSQATASATGRLRRALGLTETLVLSCVPHPALDVGDVVRVRRSPSQVDLDVLIESMTVPLDVTTAMTLNCRARRLAG